jgi:putative ABC transport system substrate-binding protein
MSNVLVAVGAPSILAAQKATTAIPIVFVPPQDPITLKVVASLARPGGNLTGLTTMGVDVAPKRVQLLKNTFPDISSIAMLFDRGRGLQRRPRGRGNAARGG